MAGSCLITADTKIINLETYGEQDLGKYLKAIVDAVENYGPAQKALIQNFPAFVEIRVLNIKRIKKIADKVDKRKKKNNKKTALGSCLGILGSTLAVGGAMTLTAATGGAAAPFIPAAVSAAGGAAATVGGVTTLRSYTKGRLYEKKKQKEIKTLLKQDKEYFKSVFPWVERTAQLEQAVEDIMNFNVFQGLMESFNKVATTVHAIERGDQICELPIAVKCFIDVSDISENEKRLLKALLLEILRSADAFPLFKKILNFFKEMAPFIFKTYKVIDEAIRVFRVADATLDVGNAVANIVKNTAPAVRFVGVFGAVTAISVAIDLWVLVSTSADMAKGSKSELARRFRHCAQQMQNELNALEQIYFALTDTNFD